MKRSALLLLALCLITCTCVSYNGYIFSKQGILASNQVSPFPSGYLAGILPPNAGGYPPGQGVPPDVSGNSPEGVPPDAGGYPQGVPQSGSISGRTGVLLPGTSGSPQAVPPPGTSGYPQGVLPPGTSGSPQAVPPPGTSGLPSSSLPTTHGCQNNIHDDEPEIFVGTDPPPGAAVSGGKIRVWVNDEGAPKIAPNEKVNPVTGQITPGDRTALDGRGMGYYRWEPALYITPLTSANQSGSSFSNDAENGGKPYYPSLIKGDYSPDVNGKGPGLKGPPIDGDYTQFENGPTDGGGAGKGDGGLSEQYTAEYIWDVNSLGLPPRAYHVQLVIHDGDDNLGIDCMALNI